MICVTECTSDNGPSFVEVDAFFIDEDTLKFDNSEGGMGVIELDGDVVGWKNGPKR